MVNLRKDAREKVLKSYDLLLKSKIPDWHLTSITLRKMLDRETFFLIPEIESLPSQVDHFQNGLTKIEKVAKSYRLLDYKFREDIKAILRRVERELRYIELDRSIGQGDGPKLNISLSDEIRRGVDFT
jgi:hypothetical protein